MRSASAESSTWMLHAEALRLGCKLPWRVAAHQQTIANLQGMTAAANNSRFADGSAHAAAFLPIRRNSLIQSGHALIDYGAVLRVSEERCDLLHLRHPSIGFREHCG